MTKLYTRNNLGVWIDRVNQPFQATDTTYLAITDSADPNDNPRQLLGGTLSGTIYMYLFNPPDDTTQVRFYIDGVLHKTENVAIFAWNGDSGGLLNGYSTTVLSNDTHIFSWEADSTSQGTLTGAATVTVSNVSSPTSNVLTMQFASAALNQKLSDAEIAAMFPEALNPDEIQAHNHDEMYIVDGTSGSIGPDYDGSRGRVLATRHRANEHYSGCSVGEPKFSPTPLTNGGGGGYDELILEYDFRYGTQWNFNSKSLGKMPGLSQIVPGGAAGMNNTPGPESPAHCVNQDSGDGSSFRHMVHCESGSSDVLTGQVITYFYTDTKPDNQCGQAAWPLHPNALDGTNLHCGCGSAGGWDGSGYSGSNMFVDGQPVIKRGVWYNLKQHISVSEQFVKTYLDDVLISFISGPPASLLSSGNGTLLNGVRWDMYIGSGPSDPHASGESGCNTRFHQSSDVWWYITNFRVYQPQEQG